jgi:hypothetical protein
MLHPNLVHPLLQYRARNPNGFLAQPKPHREIGDVHRTPTTAHGRGDMQRIELFARAAHSGHDGQLFR